jgi:hypothetical protein
VSAGELGDGDGAGTLGAICGGVVRKRSEEEFREGTFIEGILSSDLTG